MRSYVRTLPKLDLPEVRRVLIEARPIDEVEILGAVEGVLFVRHPFDESSYWKKGALASTPEIIVNTSTRFGLIPKRYP